MFDDGVQTYVRFAERAELPTLFVLNEDGTESLLNFHIAAGVVVIHRLARRFVVRRGKLVGCIVNRAFLGGGERLESGTVRPEVRLEQVRP
jgi:type IV secretion system protein VirB9